MAAISWALNAQCANFEEILLAILFVKQNKNELKKSAAECFQGVDLAKSLFCSLKWCYSTKAESLLFYYVVFEYNTNQQ